MTSRRLCLNVLLTLGGMSLLGCTVKTLPVDVEPPATTLIPGLIIDPVLPPTNPDPEPIGQPDGDPPPALDDDPPAADAAAQAEELLKAKVLTRMHSSSNIGDGFSFIEQFRSDLDLCSTRVFSYFQSTETTIGASFSRAEYSARGTWSVRIDQQSQAVLLVLKAAEVSEGELFNVEIKVTQNANGQTHLNGERAFVSPGADLCN